MVDKKFYVQGSVGALGDGERFGGNYELPNATAYNETCAAIANVYWNQRMFQLHGDTKYIDVLERSLYNGLISGVGLDGKSFFYTNAMQVTNYNKPRGLEATRSGWFECSCCPTNIARLLPSVPGYMYAQQQDKLFINLFINSEATVTLGKQPVKITQQNNYPWDGDLSFIVSPKKAAAFTIMMRIPGWAQNVAVPSTLYSFTSSASNKVAIKINGAAVDYAIENGYAVLNRKWKAGDKIEMTLPMEIKRVVANEKVKDDNGKTALQRGPLMYCAEWPDNNGLVSNYILPDNATFTASFQPQLLNGVMVLTSALPKVNVEGNTVSTSVQSFKAIPYYAWANRGEGEMMLWFPRQVKSVALMTNE
jgi:DUF1680 family protein